MPALRLRIGLAGIAMTVLAARTMVAQTPAERQQVEAFRDSIATVRDSVSLLLLEKNTIAHAKRDARDSALVHLRLGFLSLRLGDIAGRKHYDDAASEFQWVADLQPQWPYGWFGLGLAELGIGDIDVPVLRGLQAALGKDALTRSANDFARSAEVDPGFVRGLVELSNTALRQRINLRMNVALAALRRAAPTPAAHQPEVLLARARIEREVGSPDSARMAIDSLLARRPNDPTALLEQARVLFKLGRIDGNEPWYHGLALADPNALALYRADLTFILPDSLMHAFDVSPAEVRTDLMRQFWNTRDIDELHPIGERLREHYRRLDVARHQYRLASTHRHYDIVERYRPAVADFDDRGVVYIRHGAPDDRAATEEPGVPYNESWVYHRTGEADLLFHFVAREGVTDYRLVESALDVLGYSNALRLSATGNIQGNDIVFVPGGPNALRRVSQDSTARLRQHASDAIMSRVAEDLLRSRQNLSPIYSQMLASGRGAASGLESEERSMGARSIKVGTVTDDWPLQFRTRLPALVDVISMGTDSGRPVLHVVYAVPADAPGVTGDTTPLQLRAAAQRLDGQLAGQINLLQEHERVIDHQPLAVVGQAVMTTRPGINTIRVALETPRSGVVSIRDTINVSSPADSVIGLSDLATGLRSVPVWWKGVRGDTVWADPLNRYGHADVMMLYAEATRTPRDSNYKVDLVVRRPGTGSVFGRIAGVFGGSDAVLRFSFTQRGSGSTDPIMRELALQKLKPGRYIVEMTVAANGHKATRSHEFTVVP